MPIVGPVIEPNRNMPLEIWGAESGTGPARVTLVGDQKHVDIGGVNYYSNDLTILSRVSHPGKKGDSGAPCLWLDDDGNYRLVCILFGGVESKNLQSGEPQSLTGYAIPASLAQEKLGIKFGIDAPTAVARYRVSNTLGAVYSGDRVTLDGSGSVFNEPGGGPINYQWQIVPPDPGSNPVAISLSDSDYQMARFTAPAGNHSLLFKLIVTDHHGAKHSDTVEVRVVNRPTPAPRPRPRPTSTPPPDPWGPWIDTGVREGDDTDVPRVIWKQQRRTSDLGNTETRWVRA